MFLADIKGSRVLTVIGIEQWARDCCTSDFYSIIHVHIGETPDFAQSTKCHSFQNVASEDILRTRCMGTGGYVLTLRMKLQPDFRCSSLGRYWSWTVNPVEMPWYRRMAWCFYPES